MCVAFGLIGFLLFLRWHTAAEFRGRQAYRLLDELIEIEVARVRSLLGVFLHFRVRLTFFTSENSMRCQLLTNVVCRIKRCTHTFRCRSTDLLAGTVSERYAFSWKTWAVHEGQDSWHNDPYALVLCWKWLVVLSGKRQWTATTTQKLKENILNDLISFL